MLGRNFTKEGAARGHASRNLHGFREFYDQHLHQSTCTQKKFDRASTKLSNGVRFNEINLKIPEIFKSETVELESFEFSRDV